MSNQLYSGQGRDINVFAGQSLAVSSITGAYTATIIAGAGIGTALATASTPGATYGPYAGTVTIRLTAGEGGLIDYDAAVSPALTYRGKVEYVFNVAGDVSGPVGPDGSILALSEVTAYVTRTTTGTAFSGACEFAGYVCTVAAGNITVYDNTSAAGTVIVPTTALVVGALPIFGAGTNGKMALTTGCHVVLSGAATVNVLVG